MPPFELSEGPARFAEDRHHRTAAKAAAVLHRNFYIDGEALVLRRCERNRCQGLVAIGIDHRLEIGRSDRGIDAVLMRIDGEEGLERAEIGLLSRRFLLAA